MTCMAVAAGVRAESCTTAVPNRMRSVWEPIHANGVKASEPQASAVKTESNPRLSAICAVSTKPSGGCAPQ